MILDKIVCLSCLRLQRLPHVLRKKPKLLILAYKNLAWSGSFLPRLTFWSLSPPRCALANPAFSLSFKYAKLLPAWTLALVAPSFWSSLPETFPWDWAFLFTRVSSSGVSPTARKSPHSICCLSRFLPSNLLSTTVGNLSSYWHLIPSDWSALPWHRMDVCECLFSEWMKTQAIETQILW